MKDVLTCEDEEWKERQPTSPPVSDEADVSSPNFSLKPKASVSLDAAAEVLSQRLKA